MFTLIHHTCGSVLENKIYPSVYSFVFFSLYVLRFYDFSCPLYLMLLLYEISMKSLMHSIEYTSAYCTAYSYDTNTNFRALIMIVNNNFTPLASTFTSCYIRHACSSTNAGVFEWRCVCSGKWNLLYLCFTD